MLTQTSRTGSAYDADRVADRRHRRRGVPRVAPVSGAARPRRRGRRHRQPDHRRSREHRGAVRRARVHVPPPRRQHVHLGARAGRRRDAPRQPGVAGRLRADPDPDPQGRRPRHPQLPRAGACQGRQVLPRLDVGGVRRPARPPAAGDVLGQRQPDRPRGRVRRGQALRRGDDDGLPPPPRPRRADRADFQHVRAAACGRTTGGPCPTSWSRRCAASRSRSTATAARPARSRTSTTRSAGSSPCSTPTSPSR